MLLRTVAFLLVLLPLELYASAVAIQVEPIIQQYIKTKQFQGNVLIAQKGKIIFEESYGMANIEHSIPNAPETKFLIGSISKHITATAILKLQQRGLLDVNDLVSKHLDVSEHWKDISIHHLLTHTAALERDHSLQKTEYDKFHSQEEIVKAIFEMPLLKGVSPGEKFSYSNAGYEVLAYLLEVLNGKYFQEVISEMFSSLGLYNTSSYHQSAILANRAEGYLFYQDELYTSCCYDYSNLRGAGSIYSVATEFLEWEEMLFTAKVLSQNSTKLLYTPYKGGYAYGWFVNDTGKHGKTIWHNGSVDGYNSDFARYADHDLVILTLSNRAIRTGDPKTVEDFFLSEMRSKIANQLIK